MCAEVAGERLLLIYTTDPKIWSIGIKENTERLQSGFCDLWIAVATMLFKIKETLPPGVYKVHLPLIKTTYPCSELLLLTDSEKDDKGFELTKCWAWSHKERFEGSQECCGSVINPEQPEANITGTNQNVNLHSQK